MMDGVQGEKAAMRICAQCGSTAVDFSELAGASAGCNGCGWTGTTDELLSVPVRAQIGAEELAFADLLNDLRAIISGVAGVPLLRFLVKWGFLSADVTRLAETVDRRLFARYLTAITTSILSAVLETRRAQEVARVKNLQSI